MKDFDIKIKGSCEARIFGTGDETMILPSNAKIDTARDKGDITTDAKNVKIGLPSCAEKVEIAAEASDITIESLEFETLEIDAKEKVTIRLIDTKGKIDINMIGGEATLIVPEEYTFTTSVKGKNNKIESSLGEDVTSGNIIELNGKDSALKIIRA
ncbi:MAG: hypothetical protein K6F49_08645 [Saccharofermentans sp.]|nr:hypothetical protein [Saccharofermentans sp.]